MILSLKPALRQVQCCVVCNVEIHNLKDYALGNHSQKVTETSLVCMFCMLEMGGITDGTLGDEE